MIASHYAEPVERRLSTPTVLRDGPSANAEEIMPLESGDSFLLLDESLGWAWGYAGKDRRVGYLPGEALAAS